MSKVLVVSAALAALHASAPASAQMTICDQDKCEITEAGKTRKMTAKEVDTHFRKNSHGSLAQIRCKFSDDAAACENLAKELRRLFAY
jgi:L-asparaginase/Glu-tRNA(Gln) amidotransferase subunit D